jgi:N-acetylglutamate synthase-like GNAT family acetyltransferase
MHDTTNSPHSAESLVAIQPYSRELLPWFVAINQEWIGAMFELEDTDRKVLQNAEELIINNGGRIFFASHAERGVVGTCALLKKGERTYELTKMGVTEKARGLKAGDALMTEVIRVAEEMGIENLFLLTNKICEAAIHLYYKHGFVDDAEIMQKYGPLYQRCNVAMRYRGNGRRNL